MGTRIFTGTVGTRGPKNPGTYFFMKKIFKKSLNILKYSLGILFYVPIGFAEICLAIVYLLKFIPMKIFYLEIWSCPF